MKSKMFLIASTMLLSAGVFADGVGNNLSNPYIGEPVKIKLCPNSKDLDIPNEIVGKGGEFQWWFEDRDENGNLVFETRFIVSKKGIEGIKVFEWSGFFKRDMVMDMTVVDSSATDALVSVCVDRDFSVKKNIITAKIRYSPVHVETYALRLTKGTQKYKHSEVSILGGLTTGWKTTDYQRDINGFIIE